MIYRLSYLENFHFLNLLAASEAGFFFIELLGFCNASYLFEKKNNISASGSVANMTMVFTMRNKKFSLSVA